MKVSILVAALAGSYHVHAKAVFAHFMVGTSDKYTAADWNSDISLAKAAKIDAFALNIAANDPKNDIVLPMAFTAASAAGFKLFFSFDYAGRGDWIPDDVIALINKYQDSSAQYKFNGKPFVSTFEGPERAKDWTGIKSATGCYFVPDWSSKGAKDALVVGKGIVDGLFSWAAWPWGNTDMDTYVDASYGDYLNREFGGNGEDLSRYMMAVSPLFYTNLPQFNKNWLWRGDDLWFDRWEQVMKLQPQWVQIISWNDYGESHYIGPLHTNQFDDFVDAPYNYVAGMPHDGFRKFLPYLVDMYKNNISTVTQESLVAWYRVNPSSSGCNTGGTFANTHTQYQFEFKPGDAAQDKIFFSALLASTDSVIVRIGDWSVTTTWENTPLDGVGIYHGSISTGGRTGAVSVRLARSTVSITGKAITNDCSATKGYLNWNVWVGSVDTGTVTAKSPSLRTDQQTCISGTAPGNFKGICTFDCHYGYCPLGACQCTAMGKAATKPTSLNLRGYPLAGEGSSYAGLCDFYCNYAKDCPNTACGLVPVKLTEPTVSPFLPLACTGGTASDDISADDKGNLAGLCSFACGFGYCPMGSCKCTARGALNIGKTWTGRHGVPLDNLENPALYKDLCEFAYAYGYKPDPVGACKLKSATCDNGLFIKEDVHPGAYYPEKWDTAPNPGTQGGIAQPETSWNWDTNPSLTYVTLVNGTPYKWLALARSPPPYQMDRFEFYDVPPGQSVQCAMEYQRGVTIDWSTDKAEKFYQMEGTSNTFQIQARTNEHSGLGAGTEYRIKYVFDGMNTLDNARGAEIELNGRGGERAVNFVMTGSEQYGYWTSVNPPTAWMQEIYSTIKDRMLKHICMPGSHDAGMSKLVDHTVVASTNNVLTQGLPVGQQLKAGSRYFDLRLVQHGSTYYTGHFNWPNSPHEGGLGETIKEIIDGVNSFTKDNKELIILVVSHAIRFDKLQPPPYVVSDLSEADWEGALDLFTTLNNRCPDMYGPLTDYTMSNFINGKACVLIIIDGKGKPRPSQGIYSKQLQFPSDTEHWSEKGSIQPMVEDQLAYLKANRNLQKGGKDTFLVMQWVMTLGGLDLLYKSIEDYAVRESYDALFWAAYNSFTPTSYPSVILLDFVGITRLDEHTEAQSRPGGNELIALAIAVNLQIASQNCFVGGTRLTKRDGIPCGNETVY